MKTYGTTPVIFFILTCFLLCLSGISQVSTDSHTTRDHLKENSNKIRILKTCNLPDLLVETSGLIYFRGLVWTFNDSGGEPELYAWSMADSSVVQRITLLNGKNFDWEEVSQDSSFIYIGDFGNNFGNRNNLCIYKFPKKSIPVKRRNKAIQAEKIHFTYPDYQPGFFFSLKKRSAFDCEAMICIGDSLYVFTKNWTNQTTSIYRLPNVAGRYTATKIGEFNSNGLITAATYYHDTLYLLGYHNFVPFIWRFDKIHNFALKDGEGTRYDLDALAGSQTEGIAVLDSHTLLISAERTITTAHLFVVHMEE